MSRVKAPEIVLERNSVPKIVVDVLRREIRRGRWSRILPSERRLSTLLQVSRTSLRPALKQLENEGVLRSMPGHRRQIVRSGGRSSAKSEKVVALLAPYPLEQGDASLILQIEHLRDIIAHRKITLEIVVSPLCYSHRPGKALESVLGDMKADCWILLRSNRQMQEWFLHGNYPYIVLGTAFFPGVPFVDQDHKSVGRHAAATLGRLGHRRIAVIVFEPNLAGDVASVEGFSSLTEAAVDVIRHDGTAESVARAVDRMLSLSPRPTGVFSTGGPQTVGVLSRLLERGIQVPRDMSIISRNDDLALVYFNPTPAYYRHSPLKFARAIARTIDHCLNARQGSRMGTTILPEFIPGKTIGKAPGIQNQWS
jgi:DNA-binding LacI/PurR family transcriptional regulator/ribosomal protein S25